MTGTNKLYTRDVVLIELFTGTKVTNHIFKVPGVPPGLIDTLIS